MNNQEGKIVRIENLTRDMLMECYWIAMLSRPNNAADIYMAMEREVNVNKHVLFVYLLRDQVCGFIKGRPDYSKNGDEMDAKIDWLFVERKYGRRGIGAQLVEAYESHCRNASVRRVLVQPAPTVQAKSFYAKCGYLPCGLTYTHAKNLTR